MDLTQHLFLDILFPLLHKLFLIILMKKEHNPHINDKYLFLSGVAELHPEERWPGFHWAYQRGKVKSHVYSSNTITSSHITIANVTLNWLPSAGLFSCRVTRHFWGRLENREGTRLAPKPLVQLLWLQSVCVFCVKLLDQSGKYAEISIEREWLNKPADVLPVQNVYSFLVMLFFFLGILVFVYAYVCVHVFVRFRLWIIVVKLIQGGSTCTPICWPICAQTHTHIWTISLSQQW